MTSPELLRDSWMERWPQALAAWSPYTQLRPPSFLREGREAKAFGMSDEIAAIRLTDQAVMVNADSVVKRELEGFALPILAHEIGHHVFVPANLRDHARMLVAIRRVFGPVPADVCGMVANLYGDLLINDRLQKNGVDIAGVYRRLREHAPKESGKVWAVYTRAYEILWRLKKGDLGPGTADNEMEADADRIARLVRHFAGRWLDGVRLFASTIRPYVMEEENAKKGRNFEKSGLSDIKNANRNPDGSTAIPDGLTEIDPTEGEDDGSFDRELEDPLAANTAPSKEGQGHPGVQHRQPFEYGQILKDLGLNLNDHEVTTRYYRERALPHLIPFPARPRPRSKEPLAEGYETWEATDPAESLDVFGTMARSPVVIPGVTTLARTYGESPGEDPAKAPVDLDIYVDSSGSMPNPAVDISYLSLAGAILALSALRAGAKVQATLWSGPQQFQTTKGWTRDEKQILGIICGCINGSTAFPIHILRDTYADRKASDPPAHVVVISDDGIDTMLHKDEKGNDGEKIATEALKRARGGGTLVLNTGQSDRKEFNRLRKAGFKIHTVRTWEELIGFARAFVRETYEDRQG